MADLVEQLEDLSRLQKPYLAPSVAADMPPRLNEFLDNTNAIFGREDVQGYPKDNYATPGSWAEGANQNAYRGLINHAENGVPAAHPFVGEKGNIAACAVSSGNVDGAKDFLTRGRSAGYPGTPADWYSYTMMHEDAHCQEGLADGKFLPASKTELFADNSAARDYYRAYRENVVSDPEVPYAVRAKRAIDIMEGGQGDTGYLESHGHSVLSPLPGERETALQNYTTGAAAGAEILRARGDVFQAMGEDQYSQSSLTLDVMKAVDEAADQYSMPIDPEVRKEVHDRVASLERGFEDPQVSVQKDIAILSKIEIPEGYGPLVENLANKNARETKISLGEGVGVEQPEVTYETARRMSQTGAFDDNPAGQKFVERFVDGVERYEADRYGVAPQDRPAERPEIVDQNAQQYAPVYNRSLPNFTTAP